MLPILQSRFSGRLRGKRSTVRGRGLRRSQRRSPTESCLTSKLAPSPDCARTLPGQAVGLLFHRRLPCNPLLNNIQASKFELYLPGRLVASLHYTINPDEIMFVYCESIESDDAKVHCQGLMRLAWEDTLNRRIPVNVTCPIANRFLGRPVNAGIRPAPLSERAEVAAGQR